MFRISSAVAGEDTAAHDEELTKGRSQVLLPSNPTALGLNLHILKLSKIITAKTKSNGIKAWFGHQICLCYIPRRRYRCT